MKKYMLSLVALVVAVAAMAFTNVKTTEAEEVNVQYRFTGNQLSQATNPNHWAEVLDPEEVEGCDEGSLPCSVMITTSIEEWLSGKTASEVADEADTRRN